MLGLGLQINRLNRGLGAAFNPTDIAGLVIWQDASQIVGLNDGDAVATWEDASGNGLDISTYQVSQRPTYKTNVFGTKPAVLFDGVDDQLYLGTHTFGLTAGTIFAVYKSLSNNYSVLRVNAEIAGSYWRYSGNGDGYWGLLSTLRIDQYPTAMPGSGTGTYVVDVSAATQKEVWVNGVSKGTQAFVFQSPDRVEMGSASGAGGPGLTGYVAEWGMYNSTISGSELAALQSYMAAKYGL